MQTLALSPLDKETVQGRSCAISHLFFSSRNAKHFRQLQPNFLQVHKLPWIQEEKDPLSLCSQSGTSILKCHMWGASHQMLWCSRPYRACLWYNSHSRCLTYSGHGDVCGRRKEGRRKKEPHEHSKWEVFRNVSFISLNWLSTLHIENMRKPHSLLPSFCFHAIDMTGIALGLVGVIKLNKIWPWSYNIKIF